MKVKYVFNNYMIGSTFKNSKTENVISQKRIDPYHTEVVYKFENDKQLSANNKALYGPYYKGRYEIIEE